MTETLKKTPLFEKHQQLGAKMSPFAGYEMPISYTSLREEHEAVRNRVGMFDVSHMGEFIVKGKQALDLIQKVTSNDASKLEIGEAQYSCLPTPEGGIVDDLLIYRLPEDKCAEGERAYMLVVNASNIEKDWNWINKHNTFDAKLEDISDKTALLAIQGPRAAEILQELTSTKLADMKYYTFEKGSFAGVDNIVISATGYTGSGGFELYVPSENVADVWDKVMNVSKLEDENGTFGVVPVGLGARDSLRLEKGFALYGNDIDDSTSSLEAGLGWITKLKKGDFVGKDFLVKQKADGIKRRLVGIKVNDRRVARHGYEILNQEGEKIGVITSGSQSPSLGFPIALGYVPNAMRKAGTEVIISTGRKNLTGEVIKVPFLK